MLAASGWIAVSAQEIPVEHAECPYFGPQHDKLANQGLDADAREKYELSKLTELVTRRLSGGAGAGAFERNAIPGGSRTNTLQRLDQMSTIDRYIFQAFQEQGVKPAAKTNDFEFIRRVTLDLTGRIPTPERVLAFVNDQSPDKRAKLIDELLSSPQWIDKWTMFYGDLLHNTAQTTQVTRYNDGRNAFYQWIKDSLSANKPYNQMVTELIAAEGTNSYDAKQGNINWLVGGRVTGGPNQDIWDQQAANAAEAFLGLANMNCLLCHNGRGHLDQLNLWAKQTSRYTAWQYASFFSRVSMGTTRVTADQPQPYYWYVTDKATQPDYPLNTLTGNRPARQPVGTEKNVKPVYPFSGRGPASGEPYRVALAREITSDFQFARATVNYVWKQFFERGIVEPANQFDLARLDPDNPPPDPWTLQPSNARLLQALAQDFIANKYDVKWLMRTIANSETYQLSSRYDGQWDPNWEKLFARKLVRRLWGEEIHDALAQASNIATLYKSTAWPGGQIQWAMQCPEPRGCPDNGATGQFLNSFLRGDRDENSRSDDPAAAQALNMMNDAFVMNRIRSSTTGGVQSLLAKNINATDEALVNNLFLAVLSRFPTDAEKQAALASLNTGTRSQKAENLLWVLYNKVDFLYNY